MTARVTLVVVPRERFSYTRPSLESIFTHTLIPFELVYVDGGSPHPVKTYLKDQANQRGFQLLRTEHFLAPNQARNLGLKYVNTEYVLFIDNDVQVSAGWLEHLLACADQTGATVVCPLTCIGQPLHQRVHLAGGEARIILETKGKKVRRRVHEKHYFVNRAVADIQDQLKRQQCEFAEFHCMLVRRSIFEAIESLDEALLSTREHIDFCLQVSNQGGEIYCEPAAVVTYVPGITLNWADLTYFSLRWSDAWEVASLEHFQKKWKLQKDKYFQKRFRRLGHRRHQALLRPLSCRVSFGKRNPWLESLLIPLERSINRLLTRSYHSPQL